MYGSYEPPPLPRYADAMSLIGLRQRATDRRNAINAQRHEDAAAFGDPESIAHVGFGDLEEDPNLGTMSIVSQALHEAAQARRPGANESIRWSQLLNRGN